MEAGVGIEPAYLALQAVYAFIKSVSYVTQPPGNHPGR